MCGIVGFNWEDKKLLRAMIKSLTHRGPDDDGLFSDSKISLGHRRLSIIDLSKKGKQPIFNEEGSICVVFNGEIYNFKELREDLEKKGHKFKSDTDTEVIVHGYEEYGENICSYLDGMFAFAIWDSRNKNLFIARDNIGIKPLYYYFNNGKLIFASEIKAILNHKIPREINHTCLTNFLNLRFSPGDKTIFSNIKKLPPGHSLNYNKSGLRIKNYWKFPKLSSKNNPSVKKVDSLINKAVEKRLLADVPVGVFLSGGLDSSTIVAHMSKLTDKIKTFAVGFDKEINETEYARIISNHFETDHKDIILDKEIVSFLPKVVWHLDEPLSDPAALPTYLLCKEVSKNVKVALSGEGGDEVFGGYSSFNYSNYIEKLNKIPYTVRKRFAPLLSKASTKANYPYKQMLGVTSEILNSKSLRESYEKLFYLPFGKKELEFLRGKSQKQVLEKYLKNNQLKDAAIHFYFKEWLPNDLLMKVDKMSMANSLEVRVPFLDLKLISYFSGLNHKYKKNRFLFRKSIKEILPKKILKRKKQGFILPIANWFDKKDFLERIEPHISDLISRNIFKKNYINSLIKNSDRYKNDHRLWSLLNFELWNKLYIDKISLGKVKI